MLRVFPEIFKDKKLIFVGKVFFLQETNRLIVELNFSFVSSIYVVWYSLDSETFHTAAENAVVGPKAFHVPQNIFFGLVALQIQHLPFWTPLLAGQVAVPVPAFGRSSFSTKPQRSGSLGHLPDVWGISRRFRWNFPRHQQSRTSHFSQSTAP